VNEEPARRNAHLAIVAELADDGALATASGSGIGKDDERRMAPSSRLSRFIWSAAPRISCLPTSVEPVKLIFRQIGFDRTHPPFPVPEPITRLATAAGTPRLDRGTRRPGSGTAGV